MRSWINSGVGIALLLMLTLSACKQKEELIAPELPFERMITGQSVQSKLLNKSIDYAVLLPDGYDTSDESYPVVYLLHGFGDNETAWYTAGGLEFYVDKNIADGVPMIYVMPEGYNTYYIDKYNGNYPYMKMFATELVPEIDSKFRTKKDKTQRAVMGYSMGGYGALILPVMYPDVFTISVPLSMSFRTDEQYIAESQSSFDVQWAPNFGPNIGASGTARLSSYYKQRSPFHFFDTSNPSQFDGLKILIDCGDDEESLSQTNDAMHVLMRDNNISHEYRVRTGGHSWDYWKKSYPEALKFISTAVQGNSYPTEPEPYAIGALVQKSDYESLTISGLNINVLKPVDYSTSTASYPVVYLIHDFEDGNHEANTIKVFSLLRNAISLGKIAKSIIVEIPFSEETIDSDVVSSIITGVDASYRTNPTRTKRSLVGNALGGNTALKASVDLSAVVASCFLFSAELPEEDVSPSVDVFYYLDITDKGISYNQYNDLYMKIRKQDLEYEYRVRRGGVSYQAFLNGLGESLSSIKESVK